MTIGRWRKKSFCESYAFIKQKRPFRQMKGTGQMQNCCCARQ